ncbi:MULTISPECIES: sulfate transporter CysZ [Vibrio]|uniref:Sulfate transporter CysZ n=1 Tax=Vibrio algicola TaxID=2662262 RepID=A0A5Q0TDY5_9VIBR|nr:MULTISPECIES: sulfate transporter CysZ [Vibrio]MBD1575887.1 sulfate transporter CysZ [Vibrio sp. S11_S32]
MSPTPTPVSSYPARSGFGYFMYGLQLCFQPGIRRFVIFPLLINILLFGGSLYYLYSNLSDWLGHWIDTIPSFLSWLSYLLFPILALTIIATFSYFFSTVANWIAAPFNGLLAEKLEIQLTGQTLTDQSLFSLVKDTPRILHREWIKLVYYIPKALGLLILLLIPALGQTIGPILWFLFTAWMIAIQYCDYPFDNHKVTFAKMKDDLASDKMLSYSFGSLVAICTMIPIINLIVMPVAVCGATAMWVERYQQRN